MKGKASLEYHQLVCSRLQNKFCTTRNENDRSSPKRYIPARCRQPCGAMQHQQRLRAVGGLARISVMRRKRDTAQFELFRRRAIDPFLRAHLVPIENLRSAAFESKNVQQFRDIDVFGGQSSTQNVV